MREGKYQLYLKTSDTWVRVTFVRLISGTHTYDHYSNCVAFLYLVD